MYIGDLLYTVIDWLVTAGLRMYPTKLLIDQFRKAAGSEVPPGMHCSSYSVTMRLFSGPFTAVTCPVWPLSDKVLLTASEKSATVGDVGMGGWLSAHYHTRYQHCPTAATRNPRTAWPTPTQRM